MIAPADPFSDHSPFVGYAYGYPHKSAYRALTPPVPLEDVWRDERRSAMFLYLHVPFCEYRCGFCNLFTLANAEQGMPAAYLRQLRCQAEVIRDVLGDAQFARIAIGGGTPTFLEERQLAELLEIAEIVMHSRPGRAADGAPCSCEASPATVTPGKLRLLRDWGVDRLSLGVQTFDDQESRRMGRPQRAEEATRAIEMVRAAGFPTLNLDLIYGAPEQSLRAWEQTLHTAISRRPEELYLYPLYVREQTGLGKTHAQPSDLRLEAYRLARQLLVGSGYRQVSLRMFRAADASEQAGPVYCCQADGMLGLGCGARSYTEWLHYSTDYAVNRSGVRSILAHYLQRSAESFRYADYGVYLDHQERQRRYAILGLLQIEGLSLAAYRERFGSRLMDDLPQLALLVDRELALVHGDRLGLTVAGIERSDAIGPWLYSPHVQRRMEAFECQ